MKAWRFPAYDKADTDDTDFFRLEINKQIKFCNFID